MNITNWLLAKRPGRIVTVDEHVEITHNNGDRSTLWLQMESLMSWMQGEVRDFYSMYDGADLFSSTFKIAAISEKKKLGAVNVVFTLDEIQRELDVYNCTIPENASAFMYQAGIGIYSASHTSSRIYEFDTETGEVTQFESLISILEDWVDAIGDRSTL
jgi:hypothetical protein